MALHFNGIIARQSDDFRGTSAISVYNGSLQFPNFKAIDSAVYSLNIAVGLSGTYGVHVIGSVGGNTHIIAGLTALAAAGNFVLYPVGYTSSGALIAIESEEVAPSDMIRLDNLVPPSAVVFQSGVATHGITTVATVSACIRGAI